MEGGDRATTPVPTSFAPCWLQTPPLRVKTHAAPLNPLSRYPPTIAVLPSPDSATEQALGLGASHSAGADQLRALLAPDPAASGEDPRRSGERVVDVPAHNGGVAVGGQRDRNVSFVGAAHSAGADELRALLTPDPAASGEDPRRSAGPVVEKPADDRGVAVGGQRD